MKSMVPHVPPEKDEMEAPQGIHANLKGDVIVGCVFQTVYASTWDPSTVAEIRTRVPGITWTSAMDGNETRGHLGYSWSCSTHGIAQ